MPLTEKCRPEQGTSGPGKPLRKRLISGVFWMAVGRVGSIGALFFSHVLLAGKLSKPDYAAYLIVTAAVAIFSLLVTLGTPQVLIRAIRQNPAHARNSVLTAFRLVLLNCGVVVGVFFLALQLLSEETKWSGLCLYPVLVSLWFCLSAFCFLLSSALQGLDDFRSAVLVGARNGGVIPNVMFLLSLLIVSRYYPLDLGLVLLFQVVFFALSFVMAVWFVARDCAVSSESDSAAIAGKEAGLSRGRAWFLRESWPNLFNQIIAMGIVELDVFWVAAYASESDLADYGVAKKLVMLVSAPLLMAAIALGPFVSELFSSGQLKRLERLLRGSATVVGLPCMLAVILFLVAPQVVLDWTFGESFRGAVLPLRILSIGQIVFVASGCNALTLTMTGHQRYLLACSMLTLVLYCLLAPYAISHWGAVGAAMIGSILFIFQNTIVSIVVKLRVGIWTTVSVSPGIALGSLQSLLRPNLRS